MNLVYLSLQIFSHYLNLHRFKESITSLKIKVLTHPNIWELKRSTPGARLSRNFPRRNVNLFHRYSYLRTQIAKWIIVILVKQGLILSGGWYVTTPFSFFFLPLLYHQLCPASSFSCAANYFFLGLTPTSFFIQTQRYKEQEFRKRINNVCLKQSGIYNIH